MYMKTMFAIAFVTAGLAGCGHSHAGDGIEPEYTGCGTDENWRTFDDQERLSTPMDSADAPLVTAPAAGTTVPFAAPLTLAWTLNGSEPGTPAGNVPHDGPGCNNCCPQYNVGGLTTQHFPPISGEVYDLRFSVGEQPIWRVITTFQQWTPDPKTDAWSKMRGQTVSLVVWRMSVLRNDVKGGPFAAATAFTFTVGN
jgi:hypothetical protein